MLAQSLYIYININIKPTAIKMYVSTTQLKSRLFSWLKLDLRPFIKRGRPKQNNYHPGHSSNASINTFLMQ